MIINQPWQFRRNVVEGDIGEKKPQLGAGAVTRLIIALGIMQQLHKRQDHQRL
jgi:hypothetical protein